MSSQEYINLDGDENIAGSTQKNNEAASVGEDDPSGLDDVQSQRKRKKTASVWDDIIEVTLPNGEKKVQCIHCKEYMAVSRGKPTTTWNRHMAKCFKRQQFKRSQQLLNFPPLDDAMTGNRPPPLVGPGAKYDGIKMRESIVHWLMATEQPFSTVENIMFNYMMKTANPLFDSVSRTTIKADCFRVYDQEKKNLKALLNEASCVSLTTDCWKSSHQKIEYMVITGHFIDKNWRYFENFFLILLIISFIMLYHFENWRYV